MDRRRRSGTGSPWPGVIPRALAGVRWPAPRAGARATRSGLIETCPPHEGLPAALGRLGLRALPRRLPGRRRGLLARRYITELEELALDLTQAPEEATLPELARVAGSRWSAESFLEQAKGEVGLGQCEVRSWAGWHRHVTLSMFSLAHLAAIRSQATAGGGPGGTRRRVAAAGRVGSQAPATPAQPIS